MQKAFFKTDADYLIGVKENNEHIVRFLYKLHFPMVLNFILSNNGSEEEAKDVYQDAFIVLFNNVKRKEFKLECKLKTYIYSIVRRLWLNELKLKKLNIGDIFDVEGFVSISKEEEKSIYNNNRNFQLMHESLTELGEPCKTILTDFYVNKASMSEIVDRMGYTNTDNAKNQKYKCLKRLKRIFFSKHKKVEDVI